MLKSYRAIARRSGPHPKGALISQIGAVEIPLGSDMKRYARLANIRYPNDCIGAVAVPDPARNKWYFYVTCLGDDGKYFELEAVNLSEPRNLTNGHVVWNFCYTRSAATNKRQILTSTGLELFSFETKIARWIEPFDPQKERLEILDIVGLSMTTDNHVLEVKRAAEYLADKRVDIVTPEKVLADQPIVVGHENLQEQPFTFVFPEEG